MLPATYRLRRRPDFSQVVRSGVRVSRGCVVVHVEWLAPTSVGTSSESKLVGQGVAQPPKVGFVVSKSVGNSVVRHRVTRQLRHVSYGLLEQIPCGAGVVVRALPATASVDSSEMARDLSRGLEVALRRLEGRRTAHVGVERVT